MNKALSAQNLWYFMAGRGAQEKTIAELKSSFAFDTVPTNHYGANSAWQWVSALAHNLWICPDSRGNMKMEGVTSMKNNNYKCPDGRRRLRHGPVYQSPAGFA